MQKHAISWGLKSTNVRMNARRRLNRCILATAWRLAPQRTVQAVKNRFFAPVCHPLSREEVAWLRKGRPFRIPVGGEALQGWEWGRGPAVLFVHGWNGRAASFVPFFRPLVEMGWSVTAFDAPAHGLSLGTTSSYFQFMDAIRTLMRTGLRERLHGLVGHSVGAAAVIGAISRERTDARVVLISPALDLQRILYTAFENFGIPAKVYGGVIADLERRYGYCLEKDNPIRLLPSLDRPILIAHDRSDRTTPYLDSRRLAEQRKTVMLHTTEGLGHKRILADPSVIKRVINHLTGPLAESKNESDRKQPPVSARKG